MRLLVDLVDLGVLFFLVGLVFLLGVRCFEFGNGTLALAF